MRTLYLLASVPCAVTGLALSAAGDVLTFAGDVANTLGWAFLMRGRR